MANIAFDTHKFVKDLTNTGMATNQAEVLADHYATLLNDRLATKDDIEQLRNAGKGDIEQLRTEVKGDIEQLRTEVKNDIKQLRTEVKKDIELLRKDMMVAILGAQIVSIGVICSVFALLN